MIVCTPRSIDGGKPNHGAVRSRLRTPSWRHVGSLRVALPGEAGGYGWRSPDCPNPTSIEIAFENSQCVLRCTARAASRVHIFDPLRKRVGGIIQNTPLKRPCSGHSPINTPSPGRRSSPTHGSIHRYAPAPTMAGLTRSSGTLPSTPSPYSPPRSCHQGSTDADASRAFSCTIVPPMAWSSDLVGALLKQLVLRSMFPRRFDTPEKSGREVTVSLWARDGGVTPNWACAEWRYIPPPEMRCGCSFQTIRPLS